MVRISLYFDARRLDRNGEGKVRLMVNHHSRTALLDTGVHVAPEQWDKATKKIIKHQSRVNLNSWLTRLVLRAEDLAREMALSGELAKMTIYDLSGELRRRIWGDSESTPQHPFGEAMDKAISTRQALSTKRAYALARDIVAKYDGKAIDRDLSAFTASWAQDFMAWLKSKYAANSINSIITHVGYVFRDGLAKGYIRTNPFAGISVSVPPTRKRNLTQAQFRRLWNAEPRSAKEREALDLFRFSFLTIAANPVDVSCLTPRSMVNGRIEYTRRKTGRFYSVPIVSELGPLLETYADSRHLFPPLSKGGLGTASNYNKNLKAICSREGLPPATLYWARHSWASFAAELDIPIEVISNALGHSHGAQVTLVYINYDLNKVDKAHRRVIDYALYDTLEDRP